MSDDGRRRPAILIDVSDDAERRRQRLVTARERGGMCAGCGRALADGEPVWWQTFPLGGYARVQDWRGPAGRECVSAAFLVATEGQAPEPCAGCGRPIHNDGSDPRRRLAACSRLCARRVRGARQVRRVRVKGRATA